MGTVAAVEQTVHAPGSTKAQVALNTIQTVSQIAGQTVPEEHVQLIAGLINGVVDTFNKTGVFTKGVADTRAMTTQEITIGISVVTVVSGAINVYVGLRLAALQSKMKADSAALEIALMKQFVTWKDELLQLLNGKYVTATLVAEIRTGIHPRCSADRQGPGPDRAQVRGAGRERLHPTTDAGGTAGIRHPQLSGISGRPSRDTSVSPRGRVSLFI